MSRANLVAFGAKLLIQIEHEFCQVVMRYVSALNEVPGKPPRQSHPRLCYVVGADLDRIVHPPGITALSSTR